MNTRCSAAEIRDARARLASAESRDALLRRTVDELAARLSLDACAVLDRDGRRLAAHVADETADNAGESGPFRVLVERTGHPKRPVLVADTTRDDRFGPGTEYGSVLTVPLDGHGVVVLARQNPGALDEETLALADLFASYVSRELDRLPAESTARLSFADAAHFLDIADVMMVAIDADGVVTYVNRKAEAVLGYDRADLVGRDWFETCLPDGTRAAVREVFDDLTAGTVELPDRYENSVVTRDGDERVVEWHNTVLRDEDGTVTGTLSSGLDVTDQRAQQQRLQRERQKYETLVDQFPNGLVTLFDEDHRYQLVGGTAFEDLTTSVSDLEGNRLEDVFPAENAAELAPLYDRAFEGESSVTTLDLQGRVFRVRIVPVRDGDGDVVAGMTVSQDITEQSRRREELERARKRYRTLLEAAPDPVFVADAETGTILETNEAAAALRGEDRADIVGRYQSALHPQEESEAYRALFEQFVAEGGGRVRKLPDGTQIRTVDGDGETIPVEVSGRTVELPDGPVVYGIFRDVTDQLEYEQTLTRFNETLTELFEMTTGENIGETVTAAATSVLDADAAALYGFDEAAGALSPVAVSAADDVSFVDDSPVFEPGDSIAWRVFVEDEPEVVDDVHADPDAYNPDSRFRSEIVVPVGEHGVLMAARSRPDAFDRRAAELVEILGASTEAALDRAERERRLRHRESQLQERTDQLEELETLNRNIREMARAILDADSREELEREVCARLTDIDPFVFAWVGDIDRVDDRVVPRTWAGDDRGYLASAPLALADDAGAEPAVRAARTRERAVESNTATHLQRDEWRREAVTRDFLSAVSLPVVYRGTLQCVLTIYASTPRAFSDRLQSVCADLSDLLANAIAATDRKYALLSDRATEMEFEVQDATCLLLRLARALDCTLEVERMTTDPGDRLTVLLRALDVSPEQLRDRAARESAIADARLVDSDDGARIECRFAEPFLASTLAEQGIVVREITAEPSTCRLTAAVPSHFSVRRAVDTIGAMYPDAELLAKRERRGSLAARDAFVETILEQLTGRQREVVELAYRRGYFESPKQTSGAELADELGFSSSALHNHIRSAQRKLFAALFEDAPPASEGRTGESSG
ncbi:MULTISPECIES: PAS domain S-box protein [Salinibaculum]|uniref:PAS domain S-box protein n=1 Tax=Salinibaculum TaxID=2732368 RepID=UPI0030CB3EF3